jgi:long-chain-fatty-acid--[acyl-carrier-protein] ligase
MLKKLWAEVIYLLIKAVVSIRYRLRVRGLEHLSPKTLSKPGGILFLPNHPAEIDPVILTLVLWNRYKAHPLVVEQFYYLKGAHYLQTLVGAVPIPDLNGVVNRWKQKKVEKCFQGIAEGLKTGSNYLIYPAGRLKQNAEEVVGGASFVYNLVQECPETNIVLVRTTGLWGSRFSRAITGSTPDFGKIAWEGVKVVLKNFIFLTPRREVTIEFEPAPANLPVHAPRLEFNQALEKWYNMRGAEPLKLVSDHFWNQHYPEVVSKGKEASPKPLTLAPETEGTISRKIADLARRPSVARSDHLARDLGLDSLDLAELQTFIMERYDTPPLNPSELDTVEDVLRVVSVPQEAHPLKTQGRKMLAWPKEESRPPVLAPQGVTIQEAFLKVCDRMEHYAACADERMGVTTYRRLKLMALTLSYHLRKMEGERIGILLPSSTMSYVLVMATLLAGKTPVMFNWTVGVRSLNHCKELGKVEIVLSSRRFLENLTDGDLGNLDESLLLLEDVKESISLGDKLKAFYGLFKDATHLLKNLKHLSSEDLAVILFTSGTESLPKGVPLTHKNILTNQTAGLSCIQVSPSDVLYGVLPPFHSFGFSVTGIFPLLTGLKVFYAPDPTQYFAMAHDIDEWGITLLCSAPTFIKGLFKVAKEGQLRSLRLVIGGAEKVSDDLFHYMEKRGGVMLEGYGITECSPVVTLTRSGKPREGVGLPIPGVELAIIHPETSKKLPSGEEGEICIHGPNIFKGYLGTMPSPFIEFDGKKWYRSGDRGHLSSNGSLVLSGRMKRFIKIGGEMVSLAGVEEELIRVALAKGWVKEGEEGPPLGIAVSEADTDKPLIVVFAIFDTTKEALNDALRESGFGRIVKVAEVRKIEKIPATGAGKIQYSALQEMI